MVVSTPTFAQPSENSSSWRFGDQTCHLPSNNYPQKSSLNPTTESKRTVYQLLRYLKGTRHTCLRLEPREMVQKGLLEIVGAGDAATRQSVTGYHCNVQNVTMCNRSLKQTAISLSSCEPEFYAASACAEELLGLAELFKELHYDLAVRLEMDSDSARHILQRAGDQVDSNRSRDDAWQYNSGSERNFYL